MNTKIIQYLLFLLGLVCIILIGNLLNMAAPGSGIVFWVVMFLILLFSIRRFPKEEVFAFFGLTFGLLILFGLGGAYYFVSIEYEVIAIFWLNIWFVGFLIFQRRLRRSLAKFQAVVANKR